MTQPKLETVLAWRGRPVVDRDGEELGTLGALYLDEADRPRYGGVRTGHFGRRESFVPLDGMTEEGDGLRVPYDAAFVRDAPSADPDEGSLDPADAEALDAHYARQVEMVRSEEEVETSTTPMRPRERVRLRKVRVTEEETRTVPVRKEVVQLETEPPPPGRVERVEDV